MSKPTDTVLTLETDPDKQTCLACGSPSLDTGWECNDCGHDNIAWYFPSYRAAIAKAEGGQDE